MRISINRAGIINWTKRISPLMMIFMSLDLQAAMTDFAYVINDHLGTARMVVNEAGDVIWPAIGSTESNELLPFGSEIDVYQSESQYNLNFTNKELDRTFDLHYFGARYYQAGIGRFLSIDPVEGKPDDPLSWNRYLYCHNDPINHFDPDGREDDEFTRLIDVKIMYLQMYKESGWGLNKNLEVGLYIHKINGNLMLDRQWTNNYEYRYCEYVGDDLNQPALLQAHTHDYWAGAKPSVRDQEAFLLNGRARAMDTISPSGIYKEWLDRYTNKIEGKWLIKSTFWNKKFESDIQHYLSLFSNPMMLFFHPQQKAGVMELRPNP